MEFAALGFDHEQALADFVAEFAASGEDRIPAYLPSPEWSFQETIEGFDQGSVPRIVGNESDGLNRSLIS